MGQFSTPLMYALGFGVIVAAIVCLAAVVYQDAEARFSPTTYAIASVFFVWLGSGFMHLVAEPALTWPDWPFLKLKDQTWGGDDDDDM